MDPGEQVHTSLGQYRTGGGSVEDYQRSVAASQEQPGFVRSGVDYIPQLDQGDPRTGSVDISRNPAIAYHQQQEERNRAALAPPPVQPRPTQIAPNITPTQPIGVGPQGPGIGDAQRDPADLAREREAFGDAQALIGGGGFSGLGRSSMGGGGPGITPEIFGATNKPSLRPGGEGVPPPQPQQRRLKWTPGSRSDPNIGLISAGKMTVEESARLAAEGTEGPGVPGDAAGLHKLLSGRGEGGAQPGRRIGIEGNLQRTDPGGGLGAIVSGLAKGDKPEDPLGRAYGQNSIPLGDLGKVIERFLGQPSRFGLPEVQQTRSAIREDLLADARVREAAAESDAARRGVYFGSPLTTSKGDIQSDLNRALARADADLLMEQARTQAGDRERAIGAGERFGQNAFLNELARGQLGLNAASLGSQGGPSIPGSVGTIAALPGAQTGGLDPALIALLGSLFGG
jgi:hypothetical protein